MAASKLSRAEVYFEPTQIFMIEFICENKLLLISYFFKKVLSLDV